MHSVLRVEAVARDFVPTRPGDEDGKSSPKRAEGSSVPSFQLVKSTPERAKQQRSHGGHGE